MMSIADIAIVPMQDILGLGREAQMNRPSSGRETGNGDCCRPNSRRTWARDCAP